MRLRAMIMSAGAALLLAGTAPVPAVAMNLAAPVAVLPVQDATISVDVGDNDGAWYTNPLWLAIGAVALIAIIGLIVAAGRGKSNTTVVK